MKGIECDLRLNQCVLWMMNPAYAVDSLHSHEFNKNILNYVA